MCSRQSLNKDNDNFIDFLSLDIGSQILRENMLSIHIETGNIFYDNYNANESTYSFLLNQQDKTKQPIHATLTYKDSFLNYLKYFLDDVDNETVEKFDFFAHKNVKYLYYKFNDYLFFNGLNTVRVRHSKINENKIAIEEIQNRDWQYLVESVIKLVEHDKNHLKLLPKAERKIIKSMKYNYRVARRVYASTYPNIAEHFKIVLNSLLPDEIDEIENDFKANGNGLLSVCQTESVTELFDAFAMFYYINWKLPYMEGHLFLPDGETPSGIIGEKLSLKELFAKFFGTSSNGLVLSPFLAALLLFFGGKETLAKNFLTELYKNLTVEVLSSDILRIDNLMYLQTFVLNSV